MLDKPQLIVDVVAVAVSTMVTRAAHNVYPALGDVVIVWLHPLGVGVNEPLDHVYVLVPLGLAGMVIAHW